MSKVILTTTLVSNLRVLALKWTQECEKIQISNQVIMHISNEYSKLCFKQHTFSLGTIFIPKMKWDRQNSSYISHPEEARAWCAKSWDKKIRKFLKLEISKQTWHVTHLLKLVDKMCKYGMDAASIVEDTGQIRFIVDPSQFRWRRV